MNRTRIATEELTFYHGTSSRAAVRILQYGARDIIEEYGVKAAATELWSALVNQSGGKWKTASFLEEAACVDPVGVSLLLEKAANGSQSGLMAYGSFYATMNFEVARSYALRSPAGSEVLTVLSMSIGALSKAEDAVVSSFPQKYPELFAAINSHGRPVVLELRGIASYRLAREDGNPDYYSHVELALQFQGAKGVQLPSAFRIADVQPTDIVGVYELCKSAKDDCLLSTIGGRVAAEDWLSHHASSMGR